MPSPSKDWPTSPCGATTSPVTGFWLEWISQRLEREVNLLLLGGRRALDEPRGDGPAACDHVQHLDVPRTTLGTGLARTGTNAE